MSRSQRRNQTWGLLLLVLIAVFALQVMPTGVSADGAGPEPPPPSVTDTTSGGTRSLPEDEPPTNPIAVSLSLLDLIVLLTLQL